jgi:glycosyltransferase involved in cell wall biosynthesis
MRILFFSHYFPPEVNAPANRTHEHCREWVKAGHDVHVITCTPSHPVGVPFAGYRRRWYRREIVDGIVVHRVWTYLAPNAGIARRTLNFVSFVPTALWRALRLGGFDLLIGTSPQFFCAVATCLAAALKRTPWIFELRDLWPESIPAVGAARAYMPLGLLERLELRLYAHADAVVCVSRSFLANLRRRGIDARKLAFVPNGVNAALWRGGSRDAVRGELGLRPSDVLVTYIGTVGMAHDLGTVLTVAGRLRDSRPDVRFAIVGDGAELPALRRRAEADGLTNVSFTGLVARERIPDYLAATDISLVTLRPSDIFKTVLPSKMFETMAAGRPMLLAVDGEAKEILLRAGAGVPMAPGDPDAAASALLALASDPAGRRAMGEAGAQFVAREFDRRVWAHRYLDILERVLRPHPAAAARRTDEAFQPSLLP